MKNPLVAGLDVGSGKVCVVVAHCLREGPCICGIGISKSRGIHRGTVSDIAEATDCIQEAINKAERSAGIELWDVFLSIGGSISSYTTVNSVIISDEGGSVKQKDIYNLKNSIKFSNSSLERKTILIEPNLYKIDGYGLIKNPLGMLGNRLEGRFCVITVSNAIEQNLKKAISHIGLDIEQMVPSSVALSNSVLTDYQRENGVVLIDIGLNLTQVSIFLNDSIVYTQTIDIGGIDIVQWLSSNLHIYPDQAEEAKRQFGCVLCKDKPQTRFPVRGSNISLEQNQIAGCIKQKVEEIFKQVYDVLEKSIYRNQIQCGAILVGGESMLDGIQDVCEDILALPVKTGSAKGFISNTDALNHPSYAVSLGLIQIGYKRKRMRAKKQGPGILSKVKDKIKVMIEEYF
ncbi:cell division protein FtsA [bacterium Unc6]|nr:cell division protein FtsA [bacterium Unc6]